MTGAWTLPEMEDGKEYEIGIGAQITVRNISTTLSSDHISAQVPSAGSTIIQQEWDFTTKKIYENFSNFSAFHYRSKLLPLMIRIQSGNVPTHSDTDDTSTPISKSSSDAHDDKLQRITFQMLNDEFELITNAIFTEPDDQTAWWYQVFLFHYLTTNVLQRNDRSTEWHVTKYLEQIILPHLQQVRELQNETNNSSKWVLIGLLQCLQFAKKYQEIDPTLAADIFEVSDINQERRVLLQRLIHIDPDRKERYRYKLQQIH
jgi:geranylgeranyl transferase type-2 subunit alpha